MYKHILSNGEKWGERSAEIYSTVYFKPKEFREIVSKAIEDYKERFQCTPNWNQLATHILENDDRFFEPKTGRVAIVSYANDNEIEEVF